jgi:lipopolysaccharide export system protein LptA
LAALLVAAGGGDARAQKNQNQVPQNQGLPNALQGFSQNRDQPVKIQADKLEVRDKDKVATFTGNVHVTQGDTEMRSKVLVVFYEDNGKTGPTTAAAKVAQAGSGEQQQIRRIEATGGVQVTQKDQNAVGDKGTFDMQANTVTLTGNVIVTKGNDVVRGQRLVVDLNTGVSRVESAAGGQVESLFGSAPRNDPNSLNPLNPLGVPSRPPHANLSGARDDPWIWGRRAHSPGLSQAACDAAAPAPSGRWRWADRA